MPTNGSNYIDKHLSVISTEGRAPCSYGLDLKKHRFLIPLHSIRNDRGNDLSNWQSSVTLIPSYFYELKTVLIRF